MAQERAVQAEELLALPLCMAGLGWQQSSCGPLSGLNRSEQHSEEAFGVKVHHNSALALNASHPHVPPARSPTPAIDCFMYCNHVVLRICVGVTPQAATHVLGGNHLTTDSALPQLLGGRLPVVDSASSTDGRNFWGGESCERRTGAMLRRHWWCCCSCFLL